MPNKNIMNYQPNDTVAITVNNLCSIILALTEAGGNAAMILRNCEIPLKEFLQICAQNDIKITAECDPVGS